MNKPSTGLQPMLTLSWQPWQKVTASVGNKKGTMKDQFNRTSATQNDGTQGGFTLVELLVVIAIIAILAAMLLPTLAATKSKTQAIQCLSNHKQLASAWLMYASDNRESLPFSVGPDGWYPGVQDFLGSNPSNWDINQDMAKSKLWSYAGKTPGVFQCPAEQSYVVPTYGPYQNQRVRRLRSMTMSVWMGGIQGGFYFGPGINDQAWRAFHKTTDMTSPGPTGLIVFSDQREDENSFPNLFIDMTGYPDHPSQTQFTGDLVPFYHDGGTSYSFADGHSELKHWIDPRTKVPIIKGAFQPGGVIRMPNNRDIMWLQERATRKS
jgi:prepilin-type N-terminal cleavage/methylation domain-containing protein/prepilin-type processing-associated H-X9-DG protein